MFVFLIDNIKLLFKFPTLKLDIVYDLELFSRYSALLSALSGAKARVGFHNYTAEGLYRGNLLTHKVMYNTHIHIAHNFHALIHAIFSKKEMSPLLKRPKTDVQIKIPEFQFDKNLLDKFKKLLPNNNKTLIVNPYAGNFLPIRNWDIKNFTEVIQEMIQVYDWNIVLVGYAQAEVKAQFILNHIKTGKNIINLMGKTQNLYELIHVIQIGDIFLTNDSGPAHFASLTDTLNLVLFGPETPDLYGPLSANSIPLYSHFFCSPCLSAQNYRHTACNDNQCMQAISPESVIEEIKKHV